MSRADPEAGADRAGDSASRPPDAGAAGPDRSARAAPRLQRADALAAGALAVAGAAFLTTGLGFELPEAKAVVGALHVLDGAVPYRDFFSMYAPGQVYAIAALYTLFGRELWVQGAATALVNALAAGVAFVLLRRLGLARPAALALGAGFLLAVWQIAPELTSYPLARLFVLAAFERTLAYLQAGGGARLIAAGVGLGVAALCKHDVAAYAAVGVSVALALPPALGARRPAHWLSPPAALARLALGCALPVLPAAAWLVPAAGPALWRDLFAFPAGDFRAVRGEPYTGLLPPLAAVADWLRAPGDLAAGRTAGLLTRSWLLGMLPQLGFAAGVLTLIRVWRREPPWVLAAALLALACMPPFWLAAHVQQNTHLFSLALLCALLGALAWPRARGRCARGAVLAAGAAGAAGLAIAPAMDAFWLLHEWPESRALELPGVRGVRVPAADFDVYRDVADFVRAHVPPDEPIHVGVIRHDAIVINAPRFYLLSGRRSATRYPELHPGITDTERVQREMIADLEARGVRCAVLWRFGWPAEVLDALRDRYAAAVPGGGATLLDDYLRARFAPVLVRGEHEVWWRRGVPLIRVSPPDEPPERRRR